MKIELTVKYSVFTWDTTMLDDRVEVNQIALDISNGKSPEKILAGYLSRNKDMLEFDCPECKMREMDGGKQKQDDLFEKTDPDSGEDITEAD